MFCADVIYTSSHASQNADEYSTGLPPNSLTDYRYSTYFSPTGKRWEM